MTVCLLLVKLTVEPLRVFLRRSRSTERFAIPSTNATPSPIASISSMPSRGNRSIRSANTSMNATLPTRLSASSNRSSIQLVQRWDMEIVQQPRYAIGLWNKDLNHYPSLSDYLATLLNDVDKQVDTALQCESNTAVQDQSSTRSKNSK
ncbi:hypothetical protein Ddc_12869 [Ditylenchus destructor]|nr:hypothetical protein Ddc_12869 [Ditylenchus destructor]